MTSLQVSHGLSSSTQTLPYESLKVLSHLQHLDFSSNKIRNVPDTSFHFLKKLRTVELQDNEIELIQKGTFQVKRFSKQQILITIVTYLCFRAVYILNWKPFICPSII